MRLNRPVWQRFVALYVLLKIGSRTQRGPILNVELLSTFNLEPILPILQFALNCMPSRVSRNRSASAIVPDAYDPN